MITSIGRIAQKTIKNKQILAIPSGISKLPTLWRTGRAMVLSLWSILLKK